jgi:hypothetical protein
VSIYFPNAMTTQAGSNISSGSKFSTLKANVQRSKGDSDSSFIQLVDIEDGRGKSAQ